MDQGQGNLLFQLDLYQYVSSLIVDTNLSSNVHLLTCHTLISSETTSVPINFALIQLLFELFECVLEGEETWTVEKLKSDMKSHFTGGFLFFFFDHFTS